MNPLCECHQKPMHWSGRQGRFICGEAGRQRAVRSRQNRQDKIREYDTERRGRLRQVIEDERQRRGNRCEYCGRGYCSHCESAPDLHWHHRDPMTKKFNIGATSKRAAPQALRDEMEKCDLICTACHRLEHMQAAQQST